MSSRGSEVAKKAAGAALTLAGIGLGFWICLILADVLVFAWIYSSVENVMEGWRVDYNLGRIVAVIFAALFSFIAGKILLNIIKRNKNWIPMLAGCMIIWFATMYVVSSPYTSGLFNPFDGLSRANYDRLPNGRIQTFPKNVLYDPDTGQELKELDSVTAVEYQKQQGSKKPGHFWDRWFSKPVEVESLRDEDNLVLWAEKIQVSQDKMIVSLACKSKDESEQGWLLSEDFTGTYIVDNTGHIYNWTADSGVYDSLVILESHLFSKNDLIAAHQVRVGEIYHFTLTFPPLQEGASEPQLYLQWFKKPLSLDEAWANAENIPAPPPPAPTVVARSADSGSVDSSLLNFISQKQTVATENFVATQHFRLGNPDVRIAGLSFMHSPIVEESVAASTLNIYNPVSTSTGMAILQALGGNRCRISLAEFWQFLLQQPNGESGVMLTDGNSNAAYVSDSNGATWIIDVFWKDAGWYIYLFPVGADSLGVTYWNAGTRFFAH